jgi:octaprenyl-diphosphate synthase
LPEIVASIQASGAIEESRAVAVRHVERAKRALEGMPASPWLEALHAVADYAVDRDR